MILLKGFKFGMLLQLAVGPMCLLVFNTSANLGFLNGLVLVLAIALVDASYIALSGLGVAVLMRNERVQAVFKVLGCLVLCVFGLNTALGAMSITLLPDLSLFSESTSENLFLQGMLLTASNPMTIVFWSGVFSSQVADNNLKHGELRLFGVGCVLSTICFLSLVAAAGSLVSGFIPQYIIKILNIAVGLFLIICGLKLLLNRQKTEP
ncbi:MAG: LysE family transporter [Sedimentibacter sp.]|uniref:LysE family translocator n=1 Tax=Sedimentibacter sp. TaxID=1960295 RepID=UPI0031585847